MKITKILLIPPVYKLILQHEYIKVIWKTELKYYYNSNMKRTGPKIASDSKSSASDCHPRKIPSTLINSNLVKSIEYVICLVGGGHLSNSQYFMSAFSEFLKEVPPHVKIRLEIVNPFDVKARRYTSQQLVNWSKRGNAHFFLTHAHQGNLRCIIFNT